MDPELAECGEDDKSQQGSVGQVLGEADQRVFGFAFDHGALDATGEHAGDDATDDKDRQSGDDPEPLDGDQFGHAGGDFFDIYIHGASSEW